MVKKRSFSTKKRHSKNKKPFPVWIILVAFLFLVSFLYWWNSYDRHLEPFSYSKLIDAVEANKVESVRIQNQVLRGRLKSGKMFVSTIIPSEKLLERMVEKKIVVDIDPSEGQGWLLHLMIIFSLLMLPLLLFAFYMKKNQSGPGGAGKIFSIGKSKAKFFSPNTINVTFKDVAGAEEAKEDLKEIIEFLKSPAKFARLGAKIPKGILLTGAPGNGKTLLAKAVAGEASCPFFSISGSDFVEVFVGVGASRVRDLFLQAKKHAPCIIFIDEIDAVGRQRGIGLGGGNDEREQTLNQLLSEMDGFSTEHGSVIVLAASNRPDVLDRALLRPGRFDRTIEVPYPDLLSRKAILEVHSRKVKLAENVDLEKLARGTPGFSGADLENLINEAALQASKQNKKSVDLDDFEKARDKIVLGSERKKMILTEEEKKRTAYHESGHTLLNLLLPETDPFHKVTIIPRGRALGVSWSLPEKDKYSETRTEMLSRINVLLGGLVAEKLALNVQTSGAANDIEVATQIARRMVTRFGMSDLGPIVFDETKAHPYLGRDIQKSRSHSELTAQKVDSEVEKIINSCHQKAIELMTENREKLDLLAEKLLEKETLLAEEVYELLHIKPRKIHSWKSEE